MNNCSQTKSLASFFQYETATIPIRLIKKGVPAEESSGILEGYSQIVISLDQAGILMNKTGEELGIDVENDTITLPLSQEETAQFQPGRVDLQINVYYENTERDVSEQCQLSVKKNLYKKVMTDE